MGRHHMQSVSITIKVVCYIPVHGKVYPVQHYFILLLHGYGGLWIGTGNLELKGPTNNCP